MTPPVLQMADVISFLLVFMRVGGILIMMPILGNKWFPIG